MIVMMMAMTPSLNAARRSFPCRAAQNEPNRGDDAARHIFHFLLNTDDDRQP
jgi:hypothetical protein